MGTLIEHIFFTILANYMVLKLPLHLTVKHPDLDFGIKVEKAEFPLNSRDKDLTIHFNSYLNFISEALRVLWLLFLGLEYVKFDGSELMKSVKIFIEMSHSQLDTLILCSILSYCGLIKHYSTKQHINGNFNQLNLNNQEHPTLSKRCRICFNNTDKINRSLACELERRDIECLQKLCKGFMNNDSHAYNTVFTKTWVAIVGF
ncbi:hypothetical protein J3Q64DRAFT_1703561 [Phycomyces blakesleeanus]|uniref:Uncharacterized protein n=2 Tax=Phycomyces blakesleeanus TaxID=4837 RepID=A0A162N6R3_PHYB8|nr:hypothetical protein PHYBLDRAFT_170358 [Phycomyces blakesleeanus NRRL 1555(-)]OAD71698.1 hypothetical protein PHYBLDRAFT_170358 [Phycomyces blakesleeanus NRRL 1555(-)]|eukprot:XP_018289738.1 hypothetical protein PHYBLDRAFT_170358 [Phycomyces blakesleeanus NRRL 1555(-)]